MFASVYFIQPLSCFLRRAQKTQDSYVRDRGQPVDWNIPYSRQPEADHRAPLLFQTWRSMPPSASQIVVTYVDMCLNSCFSSSYGLEHYIRSHRCALLAWKLEGGQGELRSKIKPAASHPLLTFRKRYLSGSWFTLVCPTPRLWPAAPRGLTHWPTQKWLS